VEQETPSLPAFLDTLVPGRECGTCDACCVSLTIDDPDLQKPQGYRCRNLVRNVGCGVYETRPQTCRTFYCGWRRLKWIRASLRPDISRVLVRMQFEKPVGDAPPRLGVVFVLLEASSLKAEGLAETVAAAVAGDVPVYLSVPGPPGFTSGQARVNDILEHAVLTRDKAALLDILRRARSQGKHGNHVPVVLKHRAPEAVPVPALPNQGD
jgi:hypothetical protein